MNSAFPPLRLTYGSHPQNFADLRVPPSRGPHPVVVSIHGGFWMSAFGLDLHDELCESLTASGIATWNIEFRRIGDAGGGFPGTFIDVGKAIDFLLDLAPMHNLDLKRVVTLGHSAGGHLALWAAARLKLSVQDSLMSGAETVLGLRAAVSLAGVCDLRYAWQKKLGGGAVPALLGGAPDKMPARLASASPAELLPFGVQQILIHGTKDNLVPIEISRLYSETARAKGDTVALIELDGAGHFELIDARSREWMRILQEVLFIVEK